MTKTFEHSRISMIVKKKMVNKRTLYSLIMWPHFLHNWGETATSFSSTIKLQVSRGRNVRPEFFSSVNTICRHCCCRCIFATVRVCVRQWSRVMGETRRETLGGIRQLVHGGRVSSRGRRRAGRSVGQPWCHVQRHLTRRPDVPRSISTADVRSSSR